MNNVSWKLYDTEHGLSEILTEAARACVEEDTKEPKSFLASYFLSVTTGDVPKSISFHRYFTPTGECGLEVRLRLYTNVEVSERACPVVASTTDTETQSPSTELDQIESVLTFLHSKLLPAFNTLGVYQQRQWDGAIQAVRVGYAALTDAFCFALSIAAAKAASKNMNIPLYDRVSQLLRASLDTGKNSSSKLEEDRHSLPRYLVPLMGTGEDQSSGIALQTVYLIPTAANPREDKGLVTLEVWQKLYALVRLCGPLCGGRTRPDGTLVLPVVENLTDILEMIKELTAKVGLTLGEEVCVGLRFNCPAQSILPNQVAAPAKGKKAPKDTPPNAESGESIWVYSLFPGEAEVTGAQLSEYIQQQLDAVPSNGVIYIEDSHHAEDMEGYHRLHNSTHTSILLSSRTAFATQRNATQVETSVRHMVGEELVANVVLDLSSAVDVSSLMTLVSIVRQSNSFLTLCRGELENCSPGDFAELALGVHCSFVDTGPLSTTSTSDVVSHLCNGQERLSAAHLLVTQKSFLSLNPDKIYDVAAGEIPEIKRKNEKKKKKK